MNSSIDSTNVLVANLNPQYRASHKHCTFTMYCTSYVHFGNLSLFASYAVLIKPKKAKTAIQGWKQSGSLFFLVDLRVEPTINVAIVPYSMYCGFKLATSTFVLVANLHKWNLLIEICWSLPSTLTWLTTTYIARKCLVCAAPIQPYYSSGLLQVRTSLHNHGWTTRLSIEQSQVKQIWILIRSEMIHQLKII